MEVGPVVVIVEAAIEWQPAAQPVQSAAGCIAPAWPTTGYEGLSAATA